MIHFTCEHCRQSVRVDDRYGGKRGRCPHCKDVVSIPAPSEAIAALAAAFQLDDLPDAEGTMLGEVPPPPCVGEKPLEEEFILPDEAGADLADTVILPAGIFAEKDDLPPGAPSRHPRGAEQHPPALSTARTALVVLAIVVVLVAAALGFALATGLL